MVWDVAINGLMFSVIICFGFGLNWIPGFCIGYLNRLLRCCRFKVDNWRAILRVWRLRGLSRGIAVVFSLLDSAVCVCIYCFREAFWYVFTYCVGRAGAYSRSCYLVLFRLGVFYLLVCIAFF